MKTSVNSVALSWQEARTYRLAALFVGGNLILPQLCHLIPQGGLMLLPIYFFTLIGASLYGWKVGLLCALFSPLLNSLLFGMPPVAALPVLWVKSLLLAGAAAWVTARRPGSWIALIGAVGFYQLAGSLFEWLLTGSLAAAVQDFRIGFPGILLQCLGAMLAVRLRKA